MGLNTLTGHEGAVSTNSQQEQQGRFSALQFDPTEFLHFIEDEDISEADAMALLETIWGIMVAWVDLGFGIHPVQQTMDKSSDHGDLFPLGEPDVIGSLNKLSETDRSATTAGTNMPDAVQEES